MKLTLTPKTETTIPQKFKDNLSYFVAKNTVEQKADVSKVAFLLSELPVDLEYFNPLEHWDFRHIFSYELYGNFEYAPNQKNNCLFGRSAVRLYDCLGKGSIQDGFLAFDGFEVWLLEDMTFVTVGYVTVKVDDYLETTYRYPANIEEFNFDVENFLEFSLYEMLFEPFEEDILGEYDNDFPLDE